MFNTTRLFTIMIASILFIALFTPRASVALVVVWEDVSTEPMQTVRIIDEVNQVG